MNIFVSGFFGGGGEVLFCGGLQACVCVCGGWSEGHGSPTTASHAVQQLHCWIPLMSFGLRIRTTDAFGDVGTSSQRSWSAVGAGRGDVSKEQR